MSPKPGWYAAPDRPGDFRWWDGNAWTPHYSSAATTEARSESDQSHSPLVEAATAVRRSVGDPDGATSRAPDTRATRRRTAAIVASVLLVVGIGAWLVTRNGSESATGAASAMTEDLRGVGTFEGDLLWETRTDIAGQPTIHGYSTNSIIMSGLCVDCDGEILFEGLDRSTGKRRWSATLDQRGVRDVDRRGVARLVNGLLVTVAPLNGDRSRSELIALDPASGKERWRSGVVVSHSTLWTSGNGFEVVVAEDVPDGVSPGVVVIDSSSGDVLFSRRPETHGRPIPITLTDTAVVVVDLYNDDRDSNTIEAQLVSYDLNGESLWTRDVRIRDDHVVVDVGPRAGSGVAVVQTGDGLLAIDAVTGDEQWLIAREVDREQMAWVDRVRKLVITCSQTDDTIDLAGHDVATGEELWRHNIRRTQDLYTAPIGGWAEASSHALVTVDPARECGFGQSATSLGADSYEPTRDPVELDVAVLDARSGASLWTQHYDASYFHVIPNTTAALTSSRFPDLTPTTLALSDGQNSNWVFIEAETGETTFESTPYEMAFALGPDFATINFNADQYSITSVSTGRQAPLSTPWFATMDFYDGVFVGIDHFGVVVAID